MGRPVLFAKISLFSFDPNHFYIAHIPAHTEGRFAIVTDVGQGMRWTRVAPKTRAHTCGRRSRVVLTPQWLASSSQKATSADDGDKQARSPGRARRKPLKPSRAGMPGDPGATVVTNARAYYSTRAAAGATGTRHSPRPLWADCSGTTRAHCVAGMLPAVVARESGRSSIPRRRC